MSAKKQEHVSATRDSDGNPLAGASAVLSREAGFGDEPMATGWVLDAGIVGSSKIRKLYRPGPLDPIHVYCFMRATCDNWGMMLGDKWSLKATLGRYDDHHGPDEYLEAIDALVDVDLVVRWESDGNTWLYVTGHEEHNGRYLKKRRGVPKSPRPDIETNMGPTGVQHGPNVGPTCDHDGGYGQGNRDKGQGTREEGNGKREVGILFAQFWDAYPKKRNKGDAEKAWKSIKPTEDLAKSMIDAVCRQKETHDWRKEGGKYIPYPASWLRAKGWEDVPDVEIVDDIPQGSDNNMRVLRMVLEKARREENDT